MKHVATARRIPARTNPVTVIPPAPQAPALSGLEQFQTQAPPADRPAANSNPRPTNPNDVHKARRNRRSFEEVLETLETSYDMASLASNHISSAELKIARTFAALSTSQNGLEASRLILQRRPDLERYVPQTS